MTKEAEAHIKKADLVLFLVNEPVMEEWIIVHAKNAQNLATIYFSQSNRADAYRLITEEILLVLEHYDFVCVIFWLFCASVEINYA